MGINLIRMRNSDEADKEVYSDDNDDLSSASSGWGPAFEMLPLD